MKITNLLIILGFALAATTTQQPSLRETLQEYVKKYKKFGEFIVFNTKKYSIKSKEFLTKFAGEQKMHIKNFTGFIKEKVKRFRNKEEEKVEELEKEIPEHMDTKDFQKTFEELMKLLQSMNIDQENGPESVGSSDKASTEKREGEMEEEEEKREKKEL